jgi:hypothetical protein
MREGVVPESKTAALPWFPRSRKFEAVFVGINKHLEIDASMIPEFPEKITHHEINEYTDGLQPYKLSVVSGQAVFTNFVPSSPTMARSCVHDQDLSADAISYNIPLFVAFGVPTTGGPRRQLKRRLMSAAMTLDGALI